MSVRTKLAAGVIMLALANAASAEEGLVWLGADYGNGATLVYALPESDYVVLYIQCVGPGSADFSYFHSTEDITDGREMDVTLTSSGGSLTVPTSGTFLEMDDSYMLDGTLAPDETLRQVLSGTELTIEAEGRSMVIPLEGALKASKLLFDECGQQ